MPKCSKCNGQGVERYVTQLDGSDDMIAAGCIVGLMTLGASLLLTTRLRERRCRRCGGLGVVGIDAVKAVREVTNG